MNQKLLDYVKQDRLRNDILATAEFGKLPDKDGHGRTVLTGTEANRQAREYFVEQAQNAGLEVQVDKVGNIAGRWTPTDIDSTGPAVAAGSHLDSVPAGGIFDGVLGVYGALEAIRAIQDADLALNRPLEVVVFTEEEGSRFSDGVLGSSVAIGERTVEEALALTDSDNITLGDALDRIGFQGEGRLDATAWDSWLELHIEQSTQLENAEIPVGIVTHIVGTIRCHIDVIGEANHAGTTSMGDRTDALAAASELALEVEAATRNIVATQSETAVGTVGQFDVDPNSINVIPGMVHVGIDIRDVEYETMNQIVVRIEDCLSRLEAERDVETSFERPYDIEPIPMSKRCTTALHDAAATVGVNTLDLHSGAGHDTMQIAKATDAGLIFAPSRNGHSHNPTEWTEWSDSATATRLLATAMYDLATN